MLEVDQLMADPRTWRFHRLSAQPMEVHRVPRHESPLVTPRSLGLKSKHAVRPKFYRFARPPQALRDPRNPGFQPVTPTSVIAGSMARMNMILDDCNESLEMVEQWRPRDEEDAAFLAAEMPQWRSITNQVGTDAAWFLHHGFGAGRTGRVLPLDFIEVMETMANLFASMSSADEPTSPDPWDTNPGFPLYTPGWMGRLATHLVAGTDPNPEAVDSAGLGFCQKTGLASEAAWGFALHGRYGPRYKDTPAYQHVGRHAFRAAYIGKGWSQRNRIVQGAGGGINRLLRPMYTALKSAMKSLLESWHTGDFDYSRFSDLNFQYAADFSGFDASASPEVQDLMLELLTRAFARVGRTDVVEGLALWRRAEEFPLITPSWDYESDFMTVLTYEGTTHSGLKPTSVINTFLQMCVINYALRRQGYDHRKFPWSASIPEQIAAAHFGDDVRLATRRPLDRIQWDSDLAELGFKADLHAGDDFLARHRSNKYPNVPLASRVVQQTNFNEHARLGKKSIGIHMHGFISRTERFEFLPQLFQDAVWHGIRHAAWIEPLIPKLASKSVLGLRFYLQTDRDAQRRIAISLASTVGESWIAAQSREAEHSENARIIVAAAEKFGVQAGVDTQAMDGLVDRAGAAVAQLPRGERLNWAAEAFDIAQRSNPRAEMAWTAGLLDRVGLANILEDSGSLAPMVSSIVVDDDDDD